MNTIKSVGIVVSLLSIVGCVTEGGLALQPQTEEEQAQANLAVGIGYLQEGRPEFAIDALQRALELEPRMADGHYTIAIAYGQVQDVEMAEQHYQRATQLNPQNPGYRNAYAAFLCLQNRWPDARPHFDSAVANSAPSLPDNYLMNAATCARTAGDLAAAETYFRETLRYDAQHVDALRGLVNVLMRSEKFLNARGIWQRLEASTTLVADDLLSCYLIETAMGDERAASDCAGRLTREFPGSTAQRQLRELERNAG